ncbi:MAG: tetratricopeptide repeat protein [Oscillospiraceae bacterium]|nr:tetratricopeptide repeat protein [Oscillospiraceae bacterium]
MKSKLKIIIPVAVAVIAIIAAVIFIRFSSDDTNKISKMLDTAQKYLVEQNYEQAVAEFENIIELDPMNADAYIGIAEAYIKMGNTEMAVEWLEKGFEATGDESLKAMLDELLSVPDNEVVTNADNSWYEMSFNSDGKIIHEDFYDADGNFFGSADIEYWPNGNKKTVTYYRVDGSYYVSEYNEEGKLLKKTYYNSDGSIEKYTVNEFNSDGRTIKNTDYNGDGTITAYSVYEYDSNGNQTASTDYYGDGSIKQYFKYQYDSNGHIIYWEHYESLQYRKETYTDEYMWEESHDTAEYKYNDDYTIAYIYTNGGFMHPDNVNEFYCYSINDTKNHYSRRIITRDENGNEIYSESYSNYMGTEELTGKSENIYDENGKCIESKYYYKNYETGEIELDKYHVSTFDGLGNTISNIAYNADGTIWATWTY